MQTLREQNVYTRLGETQLFWNIIDMYLDLGMHQFCNLFPTAPVQITPNFFDHELDLPDRLAAMLGLTKDDFRRMLEAP